MLYFADVPVLTSLIPQLDYLLLVFNDNGITSP